MTVAALSSPVPGFNPAWGAWIVVAVAAAAYAWGVHQPGHGATRRQVLSYAGASVVALVAFSWPLADLAAHRLLLALVVQRLVVLLALPPLLLTGLPRTLVAAGTRPAPIDAVARALSRPVVAVVTVTVVAVGTLTVPAVQAQASSAVARGGLDLALVLAGVVLWLPVFHPVPGTGQLSALSRAGYLVIQSILPSFLCIVWIFARHPLYPAYAHDTVWRLTPLADQQLSGFVAKLATICVLWAVAFFSVLRAERTTETGGDPDTLTWADVARQLERVERRERRSLPAASKPDLPGAAKKPLGPVPWPTVLPAGSPDRPLGTMTGPRADGSSGLPPVVGTGPAPGWAMRPDDRRHRRRRHGGPEPEARPGSA